MDVFEKTFEVRWADVDANQHMRHSAYYDYAAHLRVQLLEALGMGVRLLAKNKIGPVLFREEAKFFREIGIIAEIRVNVQLKSMRADGSRWTFVHEFYKDEGEVATLVTVDGAWLDLTQRKLTALPQQLLDYTNEIPRTNDFCLSDE